LDGLSREELDATSPINSKPTLDDTSRQALYQTAKGILRKINKVGLIALRLAARKASTVDEAILLDATGEALL